MSRKLDILLGQTNYKSGVGLDKEFVRFSDMVYSDTKVQPYHKAKANSIDASEWYFQGDAVFMLAFYKGGHVLLYHVHDTVKKSKSVPVIELYSPPTPMVCLSKLVIYPYVILHMKDAAVQTVLFYDLDRDELVSSKSWKEATSADGTSSAPILFLGQETVYVEPEVGNDDGDSKPRHYVPHVSDDSAYAIYDSGILEFPKSCFIAPGLIFEADQTRWDQSLEFKPSDSMSYLSGREVLLASTRQFRLSNIDTGRTLIQAGPFPAAIRAIRFNKEYVVAISYHVIFVWPRSTGVCEQIDLLTNPTCLHLGNTHVVVGDATGGVSWFNLKKQASQPNSPTPRPGSGSIPSVVSDMSAAIYKVMPLPTLDQEIIVSCKETSLMVYLAGHEIYTIFSKERLSGFHVFGNTIICQVKQSDGSTSLMTWTCNATGFLKKIPLALSKNRGKVGQPIKFGKMSLVELPDIDTLQSSPNSEDSPVTPTQSSGSDGDATENRRRSMTVDGRVKSPPKSPKPNSKSKRSTSPTSPGSKFLDTETDLYFTQKFKDLENWQQHNVTEKIEVLLEEWREDRKSQQETIRALQEEQLRQSAQISQLLALVTKLTEKK